jgi:hypothetical protein
MLGDSETGSDDTSGAVIHSRLPTQPAKEDIPMADLHTSTSFTSLISHQGSPFAAELERRLASDEPLTDIVDWWKQEFDTASPTIDLDVFSACEAQPSSGEGCPTLWELTENETVVLTLDIGWSFSGEEELTVAIESPDASPEMQIAWDKIQQARVALRANANADAAGVVVAGEQASSSQA